MNRVGPGIARLAEHFFRLDDLVDLCLCGVRLGVDHVNSRGPKTRDDQVPAFKERVTRQRRQRRRTGVPAEVVKFVTFVRHHHGVDDLAVTRRLWIDIDDTQAVGLREIRAQHKAVGIFLGRRFHR